VLWRHTRADEIVCFMLMAKSYKVATPTAKPKQFQLRQTLHSNWQTTGPLHLLLWMCTKQYTAVYSCLHISVTSYRPYATWYVLWLYFPQFREVIAMTRGFHSQQDKFRNIILAHKVWAEGYFSLWRQFFRWWITWLVISSKLKYFKWYRKFKLIWNCCGRFVSVAV
jgi:hypothetical protein